MRKEICIISILVFFLCQKQFAQEINTVSKEQIIERIAESYAEELSEETDISSVLNDLEYYSENQLNLNVATREQLERLHLLTSFQIESLIAYRQKVGQIYSVYELLAIEGFNVSLADDLGNFVAFDAPGEVKRTYLKQEIDMRVSHLFEKVEGFKEDNAGEKNFSGIQPKLYLRYRAEKGEKLQAGITAENDPGEDFFSGSNKSGFDFYSGFVSWKGNKALKNIIVGDFQAKFGQGLTLWSGYGGRKSTEAISIRTLGQGIRPYSSAEENSFLRGAAATFNLGDFNLTTFYSNKNVDANVTLTDSANRPLVVSSLQTSGYHRTNNEIADRDVLNVQTAATNANYMYKQFSAGVSGVYQKFNLPLEPDLALYNQFYFRGKENYNVSANFLWILKRANFFGEAAVSKSGGKALLVGVEAQPVNEFGVSILYRNYAKDFHSVGGSAFSESGEVRNEKGLYAGLFLLPFPKFKVTAYLDLYESPWLKYTSLRPVKGSDFVVQTDYTLSRKVSMYLRFKTESVNRNSSLSATIKDDIPVESNKLRYNLEWKPTKFFNVRFRTEWTGYSKADTMAQGWLCLADLIAKSPDDRFAATFRASYFDTEDYDSRVYAFENDVPYSFYIPAFYLNGFRFYLNLKAKATENLTFYLKASQTRYIGDVQSISSGDSKIESNHRTDLKFHVRYQF